MELVPYNVTANIIIRPSPRSGLGGVVFASFRRPFLHNRVEALQCRSSPGSRERHVDQKDRKGQVNTACDDGVDGAVGDVELEEGPTES